jgi:hypothetical protein
LVIKSDGECRVTKKIRSDSLKANEVAYCLHIEIPPGWGETIGDINLELPAGEFKVSIEDKRPITGDYIKTH